MMKRLAVLFVALLIARPAWAVVAFDAASESHTATTPSTSEASFTWDHDPVGTPRGVAVCVMGNDDDTPTLVSAVTYVGVPLARLGTVAQDTIGEFATATVWFLGGSVPTDDPASVVVTRDNSANEAYAVAVTFTAGGDTEEVGTRVLLEEDGTLAEQAIDSGAVTALRLVCGRSGLADLPSAGTNSTHLHDMDVGSRVMMMGRETTPGSGSRSVGYSSGATDDRAFIHFAIAEVAGAAAGGSTMSLMGVGR